MNKKMILLGLITFIITLLWKAPATLLATHLEQNNPSLTLQGVEGYFWNGSAAQVGHQQQLLGKATWTISPLGLLMASFKGHLVLQSKDFNLNGDFVSGMDGSLQLSNTRFAISSQWINRVQNTTRLGGTFRGLIVELESLPSTPTEPPLINGTLNWEQGSIKTPFNLPVGNYQLVIKPDDKGKLTGTLTSNQAPLDIKGTLTLDKKWQYTTNLNVKTTPRGKQLQGFIAIAGKRKQDGSVQIKKSGSLSYLIPAPVPAS